MWEHDNGTSRASVSGAERELAELELVVARRGSKADGRRQGKTVAS